MGYFANAGNSWFAVVDGKAGKKYDDATTLVFSPNGKRAAYAACRGRNWLLVTDGEEGKEFDAVRSIVFSPDSKRVACAAQHGHAWRVVVDGVEGAEYDGLRRGNGVLEIRRNAYAAINANPEAVGIDDVLGDSAPVFSPDSVRVAYWARRGDQWRVIVDGAESKAYDGYLRGSHLAFVKPNLLRALAVRGSDAVRVEIEVK